MFSQFTCRCQRKHQRINFMRCQRLESDLKEISVASKIAILKALEKPHCVCDVEKLTDFSQTLISHHLSSLAEKGFVDFSQEGKFKRYFLKEKGKKFLEIIKSLI
ncbi:MAG: helix-turn-helix domain-containing protein [Microgenomates group bacterium]|jgi:DNA-binding transcriptional ArsR family regulator|nr:helix-turn-helix domain-containing protein [Microgenomates group bacterium]